MTLYIIGLGLRDEKDITIRGLETIKKCQKIYFEEYTSVLRCTRQDLEKFYGKEIISADREMVETRAEETILKDAKQYDTAFLVVGDILAATTHTDLFLRAKRENIPVRFIHNASILGAVAQTGLELYKFGKTTSMPFYTETYKPESAYAVIKMNKEYGLHTLVLLDLDVKNKVSMTIKEAISILLDIEGRNREDVFTEKTKCIGCARLGSDDQTIKAGTAKELKNFDFGKGLQCLIVPSELMHFIEEDMFELLK